MISQHVSVHDDEHIVGGLVGGFVVVVVVDQDQHNDKESRDHEGK